MHFEKWHGIGNDYLIVSAEDWAGHDAETARRVCDRHFGIGGDGILVLGASDAADAKMVIFNPDGSNAEMCGNGIRMAARFLLDTGAVSNAAMSIETAGGVVRPEVLRDGRVKVDMGVPELDDVQLSVQPDGFDVQTGWRVDVGNPHYVIESDPMTIPLDQIGPKVETDPAFPNRTNVEFIRPEDDGSVTMRVWERGVGETLACGSGACAVGLVAVRELGLASPVTVHLPGGDLEIAVDADGRVTMTGAAERIYVGDVDPSRLQLPHSGAARQEIPA